MDIYNFRYYLPLGLDLPTVIEWERNPTSFWGRSLVEEKDWADPGATSPIIQVTPTSKDFGTLEEYDDATQNFTVTNIGGGTLLGSANVAAPFIIDEVDPTYNLGEGESKVISVTVYSTAIGTFNETLTFSGAAGADIPLSAEYIALSVSNKVFEDGDNAMSENVIDNRIIE